MSSVEALRLISVLCGFSFLLFGIELFVLSRRKGYSGVWRPSALKPDFERALPLPKFFAACLAKESAPSWLGALQVLAALGLVFSGKTFFAGILFLAHGLTCFRFRGTLNGGSDMMAFVVLTGLLIGGFSGSATAPWLGLVYISIHLVYSYLKAGLVKLRSGDWRSGTALPVFLRRSLFPSVRTLGGRIGGSPRWGRFLSWSVILFELFVVLIFVFPDAKLFMFGLAVGFHFNVFLFFGLNRFFWIWMSAWPALLHVAAATKAVL